MRSLIDSGIKPPRISKMKALLLFCFVVYTKAQLEELANGNLVHLGPYDAIVQIGNLTQRYTPLSGNDLVSSRNARNLIEELRRMFKVGIHTMPPLDPYSKTSLPPFSFDDEYNLISGDIYFNNLQVTGAKRFKQNLLEIRLKTQRVDFGFSIPLLDLNADLRADLTLVEILPLHLKGHLRLLLKGISILGAMHAKPVDLNKGFFYQFLSLHNRLHIDDVVLQFRGTEIDINKIIQESALRSAHDVIPKDVFLKVKRHIDTYIAKLALQEVNKILTGANNNQVLSYLLPEDVSK